MTLPDPQPVERIRELAMDILNDRVVLVSDPPVEIVPMVFLPIALGCLREFDTSQVVQIAVFAVLGRHFTLGPLAHGWPVFGECDIWLLDDVAAAATLAVHLQRTADDWTPPHSDD